jgi:catechol 2,3-dioxygenase-like lactoylglutathione lyase family enzyme
MIGKGIFHTNIVVRDVVKSCNFYTALFGMEKLDLRDGDLVFLTTPGRNDVLTLNPSNGSYGFPGGCALEAVREKAENHVGVQGGVSHFGYMLPTLEEYERVIANVNSLGGHLLTRCDHGGAFSHTYFADPDGYVVEIHFGG